MLFLTPVIAPYFHSTEADDAMTEAPLSTVGGVTPSMTPTNGKTYLNPVAVTGTDHSIDPVADRLADALDLACPENSTDRDEAEAALPPEIVLP